MRVNELANELGKTSKQILELIKQSDPSSSMYAVSKVTPEQESAVRRALTPRKEAAPVHQVGVYIDDTEVSIVQLFIKNK